MQENYLQDGPHTILAVRLELTAYNSAT